MHRNREIRNHVHIARELNEVISLLQFAQDKPNRAAHNGAAHANETTHQHEHAHHARLAKAHATQDADFLCLVNHHHDKRADDVECSDQDNQTNHRSHNELFVIHPLEERDIFGLPIHPVVRIREPSRHAIDSLARLPMILYTELNSSHGVTHAKQLLQIRNTDISEVAVIFIRTRFKDAAHHAHHHLRTTSTHRLVRTLERLQHKFVTNDNAQARRKPSP